MYLIHSVKQGVFMGSFIRGIKNAFRNSLRTLSIVAILSLSIALALSMLLAQKAVQQKIDQVKASIGNTITVSPAGARGFEGGGEPLTDEDMAKVRALPHVTKVTETVNARLQTDQDTNLVSAIDLGTLGQRRFRGGGGFGGAMGGNLPTSLPIMAMGVDDFSNLKAFGGGSFSLTSGSAFDGSQDAAVAVVGKELATKNNLSVGSTFKLYNTDTKVVGIADAGNRFSNSSLAMPLKTLQRLSGQSGEISSAIVQVDSISDVSSVQGAIKSTLGDKADVVSQQDTSDKALAPLENMKSIAQSSLVGALGAGAVITFLTMLMIVRERRREIGVFKAIGASNISVVAQLMTESLVFTVLAAVVGITLGAIFGDQVTHLLVTSQASTSPAQAGGQVAGRFGAGGLGRGATQLLGQSQTTLQSIHNVVGYDVLLYGLGAAVVIALLGSAIPAYLTAKVRPSEVLRGE
jgi:putative ABC transport system permease protein